MENLPLKQIIEGAIMAAETPLTVDQLMQLFEQDPPERAEVKEALQEIETDCENRGFELKQVASGYRFQVKADYGEWVSRLWKEKPPRYTRATLETLALIAYKQPITRGDIEEIRGVAVSTNIIRSLLEREWIRVVGHRDVPGQPALLATTKTFLDYFNLRSLDELPSLAEIRDLTKVNEELELEEELIEARTLEIDPEEEQAVAGINDEDLEAVTQQVDTIQQNIRTLFEKPEEDASGDDFEEDDEDAVIPLNADTPQEETDTEVEESGVEEAGVAEAGVEEATAEASESTVDSAEPAPAGEETRQEDGNADEPQDGESAPENFQPDTDEEAPAAESDNRQG